MSRGHKQIIASTGEEVHCFAAVRLLDAAIDPADISRIRELFPVHVREVEVVVHAPQFCGNASEGATIVVGKVDNQDRETLGERRLVNHESDSRAATGRADTRSHGPGTCASPSIVIDNLDIGAEAVARLTSDSSKKVRPCIVVVERCTD